MTQQPSVGRIVHYTSFGTPGGEYGQECRAAVITAVRDRDVPDGPYVDLAVVNPTGIIFRENCKHEERDYTTQPGTGPAGGTWHWPEWV